MGNYSTGSVSKSLFRRHFHWLRIRRRARGAIMTSGSIIDGVQGASGVTERFQGGANWRVWSLVIVLWGSSVKGCGVFWLNSIFHSRSRGRRMLITDLTRGSLYKFNFKLNWRGLIEFNRKWIQHSFVNTFIWVERQGLIIFPVSNS